MLQNEIFWTFDLGDATEGNRNDLDRNPTEDTLSTLVSRRAKGPRDHWVQLLGFVRCSDVLSVCAVFANL